MKKTLLLIFIITIYITSFAQIDENKTNYYFETEYTEYNNIILKIKNPVSKYNFAKFELKINNKSENYIYFLQEECIFKYKEGNFMPKATKHPLIIRPAGEKSPTLTVKEGTHFLTDNFEFIPNGIYTFPAEGVTAAAEDFHLPPSVNQFTAGNFKIKMLKIKKETDETVVKFECIYHGDKIGIVSPSMAVLKTENGKEWANVRSDMKPKILQKGDKTSFVIVFEIPGKITDMQFADMDIVWKNTFSETDLKEIKFESKNIKLNYVKTK